MPNAPRKISTLSFKSGFACLPDESFAKSMREKVEPYVLARQTISYFSPKPEQPLRFAGYTADKPRDTVVISHGFTETLEKYDEAVYYLLNRGYSVFICEHRGHGLSYREIENYSLAHISRFGEYVEDFLLFIERVVRPNTVGRLLLLAHSMGGAIGVLAMERQPELFFKAVLLSPMFGVNLPAPKPITYAMASIMCSVGREEACVIGQKPFSGKKDFSASACASKAHFDYMFDKYLKNQYMQGCAASYSWLRESLRATGELMKSEALSQIKTPVLVFSGTMDEVVSKPAHRRFVKAVESAALVLVPRGGHELFTDSASRNAPVWEKIFEFFEE